jgi:predicted LPLAT superfamily acyltransferase
MSSRVPVAAEWTRKPERGSLKLVRFAAWLSLAIGRAASRVVLRIATLYFLATGGSARRNTKAFLARALGRPATLAEQFRTFFAFSSTVHDRIYFLRGRFDIFDVQVTGMEVFDAQGAILMGGHLGSFEVLRACGHHLGKREVAMAMYEANARLLNAVLAALDPGMARDIVQLGRAQSMIELAGRLDHGAMVGMLADRTLGDEPALRLPFLGEEAAFPTGPMRVAAALRRRVIFMAGLYRGGNRYEVRFEELADFTGIEAMSRAERDEAIGRSVAEYARRLERCAREAPHNWFNFHDFWGRGA